MTEREGHPFFLDEYAALIKKSLAFFSVSIRRNLGLFLCIVLAFCAAGTACWYTRTPYYESTLVCRYVNQPMAKKVLGEMVQKMNLLAQSGSHKELARQLRLSPEQASQIIGIEAKNRAGSPLYEDITEEYQPVYFDLKAAGNNVFAPVQEAIVAYLSNSAYERRMAAAQVARYSLKIDYLLADLQKVDSIADAFTVALRNGIVYADSNRLAGRFDINGLLAYKEVLEERLINLERQRTLDSGAAVMVVHGFVPGDRPTKGSKKVIGAFAIIGLLTATAWAVLNEHKQEPHV